MTLKEFKRTRKLTDLGLAALLGASGTSAVGNYMRLRAIPHANTAARISAATGGEVSILELLFPLGLPVGTDAARGGAVPERQPGVTLLPRANSRTHEQQSAAIDAL